MQHPSPIGIVVHLRNIMSDVSPEPSLIRPSVLCIEGSDNGSATVAVGTFCIVVRVQLFLYHSSLIFFFCQPIPKTRITKSKVNPTVPHDFVEFLEKNKKEIILSLMPEGNHLPSRIESILASITSRHEIHEKKLTTSTANIKDFRSNLSLEILEDFHQRLQFSKNVKMLCKNVNVNVRKFSNQMCNHSQSYKLDLLRKKRSR